MTEQTTTETIDAVTPEVPSGPAISLADLQNVVKVIDYAAEQGAFKGWAVIEQVIQVRNKVNEFVVASLPKEEPKEEPKPKGKKKAAPAEVPAPKAAPVKKSK